ncbi:MAG TPA: hypothetical protein P5024_00015 [Burkholderiaceae bacterium]|jgi:hypothetical protein|nr:hypothetical protein [Burkholderiaceae bacterium]HPE00312.1 hypothetical protein [Burkholderiaceae bacterium]HRY99914.1 hypothetical protein [Burkholderiaceae bacterium]
MTAKKAELEKRKGLQISNALRQGGNPYGPASAAPEDRKARRAAERAAGLVPVALKLSEPLLAQLHERAQAAGQPLSEVVTALLEQALAAPRAG